MWPAHVQGDDRYPGRYAVTADIALGIAGFEQQGAKLLDHRDAPMVRVDSLEGTRRFVSW
jgi:hypothetical protein